MILNVILSITSVLVLQMDLGYAQSEQIPNKIRFYEDVAATLTGDELSSAALELVKANAPFDEVLSEIKTHPHFAVTVGSHWLEPLSILSSPNINRAATKRDNGNRTVFEGVTGLFPRNTDIRNPDKTLNQRNAAIDTYIDQVKSRAKILRLNPASRMCNGVRTTIYSYRVRGATVRKIRAINKSTGGKIVSNKDESSLIDISESKINELKTVLADYTSCDCDSAVDVEYKGFTDVMRLSSATKSKACKAVVRADACGANLQNCYIERGEWVEAVNEAISLEPAAIIGKTIQDERKFREVLTGKRGAVNFALKDFLSSKNKGKLLLNNTPGGYGDIDKVRGLPKDYKVFSWVNHTNGFGSGVASTVAFQRATNGRRAKVNKLMQTFMCSEFSVPDGSVFAPDDNPDLTKRNFCAYCHRTLEPMAKLYGKWPALGTVEYLFDPSSDSKGQFLGKTGNSQDDLNKIIADSKAFKGCSVARGFNLIFGRNMSNSEMRNVAPDLIKEFESSENLWSVMKKIITYKAKKYYGLSL